MAATGCSTNRDVRCRTDLTDTQVQPDRLLVVVGLVAWIVIQERK